jgi:hypothetical protein
MLTALLVLLAALPGLLARLLLPATLLLTRLTWLWIALLLLVTIRILVLLRHVLLLGDFSTRPELNAKRAASVPDGTRAIVR